MALALSGCAATYRFHGYVPSDEALAAITPGRTTRAQVEEAVGRPSAAGVLREDAWYYVASTVRHFTYNAPEVVDRQVVAISFASSGRVSNVERFTLQDGEVVALSRRVTDTSVRGVSFIGQLLRGIGRIRAEDLVGN
ncbi:MAG: outer membrane protein assembly factor BamE [Rhodobacteraceae bacterium]|nr:outer membrane protein assembly factor BamE [Paracoccaceae bacterium]